MAIFLRKVPARTAPGQRPCVGRGVIWAITWRKIEVAFYINKNCLLSDNAYTWQLSSTGVMLSSTEVMLSSTGVMLSSTGVMPMGSAFNWFWRELVHARQCFGVWFVASV